MIRGQVKPIKEYTEEEIQVMYGLMNQFYDNTKESVFRKDFFEKDYCLSLYHETDGLVGFTTQKVLELQVDGRKVHGVFSGDTIIHKDYWGDMELFRIWADFWFDFAKQYEEFYWFLICKGYKTYRMLPLFFSEFYPNYRSKTPHYEQSIMDTYASLLYGDDYNKDSGVMEYKNIKDKLKEGVADIGSRELEDSLGDHVIVQRFFGVGTGEEAERAMEIAIKNGAEVIFATTASLITACRRVAGRHPDTKILNCSVCMPYTDVRTYYSRIYEGKFISGAIAGAVSQSDTIGYIASYPIFGAPAGINAFALGARMTNPNAKIQLAWSCVEGDPLGELIRHGVDVVSTLDVPQKEWNGGQLGTFQLHCDGSSELLASPYWDWGAFYVQIVRSILGGNWDSPVFGKKENRAVNYWWGMSSGAIGIKWPDNIPSGTKTLANLLSKGIKSGELDPFLCEIVSQDGTVRNDGNKVFTPEEILHMDWLCDNVYGSIPEFDALSEKGQAIARLQGIYRDRIPPSKSFTQV